MEDDSFFSTQNYLTVFKIGLDNCISELGINATIQTKQSFSFSPETNVKKRIVSIPHRGLLYLVLYDTMLEKNLDCKYLVEDIELLQISLEYCNIEAIRRYSLKYLQDLDRFNTTTKFFLVEDIKYYYQFTFLLIHELTHIWVNENYDEYLKKIDTDLIESVKQWSISWWKASGRQGSYNISEKEIYQLLEEVYCDMTSYNSIVNDLHYNYDDKVLLYDAINIIQSKQKLHSYLSNQNVNLGNLIAFSPAQSIRMMTFINEISQNKEIDRNLTHLPKAFVVGSNCKENYLKVIQEGVNIDYSCDKINNVILAINDAEEKIIDGKLSGDDIKVHCWLDIWNKL